MLNPLTAKTVYFPLLDVTLRAFAPSSILEAATGGILWKKVFLEISQNAQVFSCEICEIAKNTFFTEHLWMTAPGILNAFIRYYILAPIITLFWIFFTFVSICYYFFLRFKSTSL